jgi:hypothetical protein
MKRIYTEEEIQRRRQAQKNAWRHRNPRTDAQKKRDNELRNIRRKLKGRILTNCEKERAQITFRNWYYKPGNKARIAVSRQKRFCENAGFKIGFNLRQRIIKLLKNHKAEKACKTLDLIACDKLWLKAWLEIQFQPGMTWENYGAGWHIDHIRPCASFDLTDPKQQRLCFHWTNLQPLWAAENLHKGDRWDGELAA